MNYALQVMRGRSDANTLRLMDGVNSIGRHDDCLIRIRSSQVSRRHCELFEEENQLILRDLGSSNGTLRQWQTSARQAGPQARRRLDHRRSYPARGLAWRETRSRRRPQLRPRRSRQPVTPPSWRHCPRPRMILRWNWRRMRGIRGRNRQRAGSPGYHPPGGRTVSKSATKAAKPAAAVQDQLGQAHSSDATTDVTEPATKPQSVDEEDAVAQFLMDLKLDEND